MDMDSLLSSVNDISRLAGGAILDIYRRDGEIGVSYKKDRSPLTEADLAAHNIIVAGLQALHPKLPVLSEESEGITWQERKQWQSYWLVDPLDGTKEFINRNGEFTVNIALIDNGVPVLGAVYVPVSDTLYYGCKGKGAYKSEDGVVKAIQACRVDEESSLRVVASRNHRGVELTAWLASAEQKFSALELLNMGSSLKICLIAEGKADIYPRLALTSEWDTGAAQAILEAAGGSLTDLNHQLYRYNLKENILNPYFLAFGDKTYAWDEI